MAPKREGPIWEAMQAAADVLDLNREGQAGHAAYNADVTPIIKLAESILDQCAAVADAHAAHQGANLVRADLQAVSAEFMAGYRSAAESIAATIRQKKG